MTFFAFAGTSTELGASPAPSFPAAMIIKKSSLSYRNVSKFLACEE
eukprot:CAMPEP_0178687410 /NCGR_PEP_ID=MMETSP0699-20121125/4440_2 /TAXON_ID=265572 /ORGANISM="Extubocellulus spinifer, Strain CCMP396" /LENGTH=45 /DNA_ID= /DNA_START= /DNA_END= /DNA_ORIENTATION=